MRINSIQSNSFKGYDARPLKGFFMGSNTYGIADEMKRIGDKEGFKIYAKIRNSRGSFCNSTIPRLSPFGSTKDLWAQDIITFGRDRLLSYANFPTTKTSFLYPRNEIHITYISFYRTKTETLIKIF